MHKYDNKIKINIGMNIDVDKNILYELRIDEKIDIMNLIEYLNKLHGAHIIMYVTDPKFDFNKFIKKVNSEFFDVFNNFKERKNFSVVFEIK
jgi:hypothetical protein